MAIPLREKVLAFLGEHHVMTLSTAGPQGPWAAAVFYAHDNLRLYFLSSPTSRHAECLAADPRAAATIQRDYDDWPGIRGLQLTGSVRAVAAADEARVRALYQQRYPLIGGGAGVPRKILEALQKIRWYELVPDDIYLIDNTLGFAHREHMPVK
ncbi:MAG: pyridoxamine 5'-phosphate oxidase family protein [Rhodocyclaceae bacterium]|nr:pyridoxamine 5'-phosphate oxidase family protein [Rhodocyclaceae bacterium]MBZ0133192.1 pyridoxamine 5'-phosphate oxidase family protein [Rhodocyclaceae bacterium]MCP5297209.1 pyridoxamine 5'-phosphate oxidase family protein [Zoogloeaceae bacterium]